MKGGWVYIMTNGGPATATLVYGLYIYRTAFINFMMKPDVAAKNSNFVNYATGNAASLPLVDESVRNDPGVSPPAEVKAKLFPDLAASDDFTRLVNRSWTRFTTGQ